MRHKVEVRLAHGYADYLAIVISERRKAVLGHELTSEENSTRGMPVEGLTARMLPSSMRSKAMHESDRSYRAEIFVHRLPVGS